MKKLFKSNKMNTVSNYDQNNKNQEKDIWMSIYKNLLSYK